MGYPIEPAVDYDPHQVISNRMKAVRRKPFKHAEVAGLEYAANWDDYQKENPKDIDVQEDSSSSVKDITSFIPNISKLVAAVVNITPLASQSEKTSK